MDQHVWEHKQSLNELVPKGKQDLLLTNWELSGYSKSAKRTGFKLGCFRLDAGHSVFDEWDILLVSHKHEDHIFSFPSFFLVNVEEHCRVFSPGAETLKEYARLLKVNSSGWNEIPLRGRGRSGGAQFVEAKNGESHTVKGRSNDTYQIDIIGLQHSVPAFGYCVSKMTRRISPELAKVKAELESAGTGRQFGQIMKALRLGDTEAEILQNHQDLVGVEPMRTLYLPQFCFITDTAISGLCRHIDMVKEYPIVIIECTFYHRDNVGHADAKDHIHWNQIESFIRLYSDTLWVLIHSSARYRTMGDVLDAIKSNYTCPEGWVQPDNCIIWI